METKKFNEKESLELIAQMIQNTKQNLDKSNGNHLIVAGATTLVTSIIIWILLHFTGNPMWQFMWFLIPAVCTTWGKLQKQKESVTTHIDRMIDQLWVVIAMFCVSLPVVASIFAFYTPISEALLLPRTHVFVIIPFIEIVIVSLGIATTGVIIDFKAMRIAGFTSILLAFGTLITTGWAMPCTFTVWSVTALIIPGVKLNLHNKRKSLC